MKEGSEHTIREREARKKLVDELTARGWVSTGDIPYSLSREIGKSAGFLAMHVNLLVRTTLEERGGRRMRSRTIARCTRR